MTRRWQNRWSKILSIIITIVIVTILGFYVGKTIMDYRQDKLDEELTKELEELFKKDNSLYEEVLPEESTGDITVLPPSNADLLTANLSYIGIIEIPALGIRKPIVSGTTRKDIANKVGWDPHTAKPGSEGNTILAAHNAANFFLYIYRLKPGDIFIVTTREGTFTYRVWSVFKVHKTETWVYDRMKDHPKNATLITCNVSNTNYRWIVRGDLVE